NKNEAIPFELAYCVTVHAAQGGQWNRVAFILDAEVDQRLFYTATTRAELETVIFDENNLLSQSDLSLPYGPQPVSKAIGQAIPAVIPIMPQVVTPVAPVVTPAIARKPRHTPPIPVLGENDIADFVEQAKDLFQRFSGKSIDQARIIEFATLKLRINPSRSYFIFNKAVEAGAFVPHEYLPEFNLAA
ncbi:MAG: UvrD-like helicase C-terminal domain, partial [Cypionkella sp.]|uniref:helicase C-terminal domain-containing protein n=1 Tax=Cypionkella sp. TaxID=2811411 RepID=UPI00261AA1F2